MAEHAQRGHGGPSHQNEASRGSDPGPGKSTLVERAAVQQRAEGGAGDGKPADGVHAAAARGVATASSPLPHADTIQRAFGHHDISQVKAHVGPDAASAAGEMGAQAFASGDHVVLGKGTDLHTTAHEAAHVVQQRAGVHLKGGVGEAGDPYERHADEVADLVVQGNSAEALLDQHAGGGKGAAAAPAGAVQRKLEFGAGTEYLDPRGAGKGIAAAGYHATLNEAIAMTPTITVSAAAPRVGVAAYTPDDLELTGSIKVRPLDPKDVTGKTEAYQERLMAMAHETRHGIDDLTKAVKFRAPSKTAEKIQTEWRAFASQSVVAWQLAEQQQPVSDRYLMDLTSYESVAAFMTPGARMFETTKSYMILYNIKSSPSDTDIRDFMTQHQSWITDAVAMFTSQTAASVTEQVALNLRPGSVQQSAWSAELKAAGWSAGPVTRATVMKALRKHYKLP